MRLRWLWCQWTARNTISRTSSPPFSSSLHKLAFLLPAYLAIPIPKVPCIPFEQNNALQLLAHLHSMPFSFLGENEHLHNIPRKVYVVPCFSVFFPIKLRSAMMNLAIAFGSWQGPYPYAMASKYRTTIHLCTLVNQRFIMLGTFLKETPKLTSL